MRESVRRLKLGCARRAQLKYGKLLGEGKVAQVFEYGEGRVLKLYRAGQPVSDARRELSILDVIEGSGIAAPRAFDLEQVEGRWGLVMSRVDGRPFAEPMLADPARAAPYFAAMAELQLKIHAAAGAGLAPLKVRLARKIEASGLGDSVRRRLRERLRALPEGDRVLHGDFHPFNVLGTLEGATVVDWLDATCGPPAADLCRSWLLLQTVSADLAESYVSAYFALSPIPRDSVFAWLPVRAAARLAENVPDEVYALMAMAEAG
ncbi:MAG: aminoglycoside phosphotransferase family protein [Proteobacteria bacterium]|nr:MAG: aminoglycoside phosphotransferase family protein [Pseudomonadota bacterium]